MPITIDRLAVIVDEADTLHTALTGLQETVILYCNERMDQPDFMNLAALVNSMHQIPYCENFLLERKLIEGRMKRAHGEKLRQRRKRQLTLQARGQNSRGVLTNAELEKEVKKQIAENTRKGLYEVARPTQLLGPTQPLAAAITCQQKTCYTPSDCECAEECLFSSPEMAAVPTFEEVIAEALPGAARLAHADAKLDTVLGGDIFAKEGSDV